MNEFPRALVVDDDLFILKTVGDVLCDAGWEVQLVQQPTFAVAAAKSFKPDVILVDQHMPVMGGNELLKSLRSFRDTSSIPLVFLTGVGTVAHHLAFIARGADDVLVKPFRPAHVARLTRLLESRANSDARRRGSQVCAYALSEHTDGLLRVAPKAPYEATAEFRDGHLVRAQFADATGLLALEEMLGLFDEPWVFESRAPSTTPKSLLPILVVDDDAMLALRFADIVERAGFSATTARNGREALALLERRSVEAVVSDFNMPLLDGWGLLGRMRELRMTRELPFALLSSHAEVLPRLTHADFGACFFMEKTLAVEQLVPRLRAMLAPRLIVREALGTQNEPVDLEPSGLGPAWCLSTFASLALTGEVRLPGHPALELRQGVAAGMSSSQLVAWVSGWLHSTSTAQFLPSPRDTAAGDQSLAEALALAALNEDALQNELLPATLSRPHRLVVDAELLDLFQKLAASSDEAAAKAWLVDGHPFESLPAHLGVPSLAALASVRELVRRRVVRVFPQ